jgi:hypothetical protein
MAMTEQETKQMWRTLQGRHDPFPGRFPSDDGKELRIAAAGLSAAGITLGLMAAAEVVFFLLILYWLMR